MCCRFYFFADANSDRMSILQRLDLPDMQPRYNIAPGQQVMVVANTPQRSADFFLWGLVPPWAKDTRIASKLLNARVETLAEKPSFCMALRRRRCLIPADGFYEWHQEPGAQIKTPYAFRLKSGLPFAFAGLWEVWMDRDSSELHSFTIITTESNALVERFHDRMPIILDPAQHEAWLNPDEGSPKQMKELLQPIPASEMIAFPVSTLVNNVRNDFPACVEPVGSVITV